MAAWRVAIAGVVLCALASTAGAEQRLRVSLLVIRDDTARARVSKLRRTLSQSLARWPGLELVGERPALDAANRQGYPVGRWLDPGVLSAITKGMRLDAVLAVRVTRSERRYQITLQAVTPTTAYAVGSASMQLRRPRLLAAQADRLVRTLIDEIAATRAAPAKPEPGPEAAVDPEQDAGPAVDPEQDAGPAADPEQDAGPAADPEQDAGPAADPEQGPAAIWGDDLAFDAVDETAAVEQQVVDVGGRIEAEHFAYPVELHDDRVPGRDSIELELSVQATGEKARGYGSLLLRRDFAEPTRDRTDIQEAYAELDLGSFALRAGRIVAAWGTASLVNPSDILNPIDLRDPIDPIRHGTWMVRAGALLGPVSLEAYYLPVPEAHLVPFPDRIDERNRLVGASRWVKGTLDVPVELPLRFNLGEQAAPPPSPRNSQAAVRLAASGFGVDLSLAYAYLFDHFPTVRAELTPAVPIPVYADVDVQFDYLRQHVVTADFEGAVGKFRFAGEGAVFLTEDMEDIDPEVANPYAAMAGGIDYRSAQFWTDNVLHLFVDVTFTRALVGELQGDDVGRLRYPFQSAVLARVTWEVGDTFQAEVNAISALDRYDILVYPELRYTFYDRVEARVGFAGLLGDGTGLLGRFRRNSRAVLGLEVKL